MFTSLLYEHIVMFYNKNLLTIFKLNKSSNNMRQYLNIKYLHLVFNFSPHNATLRSRIKNDFFKCDKILLKKYSQFKC